MARCYYIDLPRPEGIGDPDNSWTNVKTVDTYKEAVAFCEEHWNAKDGKADLITEGERGDRIKAWLIPDEDMRLVHKNLRRLCSELPRNEMRRVADTALDTLNKGMKLTQIIPSEQEAV
jgi:hypothetical protein